MMCADDRCLGVLVIAAGGEWDPTVLDLMHHFASSARSYGCHADSGASGSCIALRAKTNIKANSRIQSILESIWSASRPWGQVLCPALACKPPVVLLGRELPTLLGRACLVAKMTKPDLLMPRFSGYQEGL